MAESLFERGRVLGFTKETIDHELQHAAKLHNKNRGELAELAFMRKAAALGFSVAKPWGEAERYDVVVRHDQLFWRVQIKSVWRVVPQRGHYRVRTVNSVQNRYTASEIDFLVAYVFHLDSWYVFPVNIIGNRNAVYVTPGSKKSHYEQYREAWDLMRGQTKPGIVEPLAGIPARSELDKLI